LKEGFSKSFQRRIQSLEFDSCQVSAELPVDLCLMLIAFSLPSIDLLLQGFTIWNPAIQALGTKKLSGKKSYTFVKGDLKHGDADHVFGRSGQYFKVFG
jgi:hypothetical protein